MSEHLHDGNGTMEDKSISRERIINMLEVNAPWSAIVTMLTNNGADAYTIAKIQSDLGSYSLKPGLEPVDPGKVKP